MATYCLGVIVRNKDVMESRDRISRDDKEGESISDKLAQIKRMIASSLFIDGETRLNQSILKNMEEHTIIQNNILHETKWLLTILCSLFPLLYFPSILTQLPGPPLNSTFY